jgi:thermitase
MKRHLTSALLVAILLSGLGPPGASTVREPTTSIAPAAAQSPPGADFEPGRMLLKFQPGTPGSQAQRILEDLGLTALGRVGKLDVLRVAVPEGQEETVVQALSRNPRVEFAELNYMVHATIIPNDYYYSSRQWGPGKIQAPAAWDILLDMGLLSDPSITIAVLDTGVDLNHPDLYGKIVQGYDFVNNDSVAQDDHGHGTHVAGIAAAETNNSTGVAGLSWGARIMPLKVLDEHGDGYYSDVADAVLYACDHGAEIINMSLGGSSYSSTLDQAVEQAYADGCLMAAASGNGYGNGVDYPAKYAETIAVAATNQNDQRAGFSDYGPEVDVAAPGEDIYSTVWNDSYSYKDGTSMATPYVAGLAAMIWTVDPSLTNAEVQDIIETTADDLGAYGWDQYYGHGRINAFAAVEATAPAHTVSTPNTPSGPSCGQPEQSLTYTTGGAVDNQGHAIQYRFNWGDGQFSGWSFSNSAQHAWPSTGIYTVQAQARCSQDPNVISLWSSGKTVNIAAPTLTVSPDSLIFLADDTIGPWPLTLLVGNDTPCGSLSWDATADESWVVIQPEVGSASWPDPTEIEVTVDKTDPALAPGGTYAATITISSGTLGALETPQYVDVTFAYSATPLERRLLPLVMRQ